MAVGTKIFPCPHCDFETEKDQGWRQHMSKSHGGYHKEELQKAGLEENAGDRIRYLSGFRNMNEVQAAAPETEGGTGASGQRVPPNRGPRQSRLTKEEQEKAKLDAEFERLRPMLVKKWERRLRMVYGTWARLADDKKIALEDKEASEGAEMHVELMIAFGWVHAGKIEAIADLLMWHGSAILARSEAGQALMRSFETPQEEIERGPVQ